MKKARKVEVPEVLTEKEFMKLQEHLRNSVMWYIANSQKSEKELRQKMYDKGYPVEDVELVTNDGRKESRNFVDEEIAWLELTGFLDDKDLAERIAIRTVRSGKGLQAASQKLFQKGFKKEDIDAAISAVEEYDLSNSLEKAGAQAERSPSFKKATNIWGRKRAIRQRLTAKGFSSSDIATYIAKRESEWD